MANPQPQATICQSLNGALAADAPLPSLADEFVRKNSSGAHSIQQSNPLAVENVATTASRAHKPHRRLTLRLEQAIAIAPKMHAIGIRFATLMPQNHVSSHVGVKIRMLAAMN